MTWLYISIFNHFLPLRITYYYVAKLCQASKQIMASMNYFLNTIKKNILDNKTFTAISITGASPLLFMKDYIEQCQIVSLR